MKTLQDYIDYLISKGYKITERGAFTLFNGCLSGIDMVSPNGKFVWMECEPSEEYWTYIMSIEEDEDAQENFEWDYNRMIMRNVTFESSICNVSGFMDDDRSGITLVDDSYINYYPHRLSEDMFKKCVWIQNNVIAHEQNILEAHLKNIKEINENIIPFLKTVDYYQSYSSIFDSTYNNTSHRDCSDLFVEFESNYAGSCTTIWIATDCITGQMKVNGYFLSKPFKDWFYDDFIKWHTKDELNGKVMKSFLYLVDNNYNRYSYDAIGRITEELEDCKMFGREFPKNIDWTNIPEKEIKVIKDRYGIK